jgi:hypothetical protein
MMLVSADDRTETLLGSPYKRDTKHVSDSFRKGTAAPETKTARSY